jgi:transposase
LGLGGVGNPPYSPDLIPSYYWLFARVKEHLQGKQYESEDDISTAVMASLHHMKKDEYRAALDCSPHSWEKCVDSAGDSIV